MQRLQHLRCEYETLCPRQVLEYESFVRSGGLTCDTALNKHAAELHVLRVGSQGMDKRERVFAFV